MPVPVSLTQSETKCPNARPRARRAIAELAVTRFNRQLSAVRYGICAQIEKRVLKLAHVEERRRVCRLEKARRCVKPAARLT